MQEAEVVGMGGGVGRSNGVWKLPRGDCVGDGGEGDHRRSSFPCGLSDAPGGARKDVYWSGKAGWSRAAGERQD